MVDGGVEAVAENVVIGKYDAVVPSGKAHATELPDAAATVVRLPSRPSHAHKVCTSEAIVILTQISLFVADSHRGVPLT